MALISVMAVAGGAACGGGMTSSPTAPLTVMSGLWIGNASDSSGTMMGGAAAAMMGDATWTISQSGDTFRGTMRIGGHDGGTMTVTGTMAGRSGTFTMTMPNGSMMMSHCSATATGTFDMDEMMREFHGAYSGTNTCIGAFNHGQMTMRR